jgi:CHAT domain-containing protein/Tfp pilus assembly protein PilF
LVRGDYRQVLSLLDADPDSGQARDSIVKTLALRSVALARLGRIDDADLTLRKAEALCAALQEISCGEVLRARGVFLLEEGQPAKAKHLFEQTTAFARLHGDRFLEATTLLNLGLEALREQHYDEAVDWTEAAYRTSLGLGAGFIAQKAVGNLGWAYYYLGDFERSLKSSLEAEKLAIQAGSDTDRSIWIMAAGYVYASQGNLAGAMRSYQQALDLANKTGRKEAIFDAYRALALVSVENGDLNEARKYSDEAIAIAHADNNRRNELYPILVKGMIAARSHDGPEAERIFREVERDDANNAQLKFRSEYALARLYEDQGRSAAAYREYQAALKTIEASREAIKRDELKLPFSNNARHVYDAFVHFLAARGKSDEALQWADLSRARTLTEGLLPKESATGPTPLNPQQIARRASATILFYWLGEKQSYLWAITPQKVSLFTLPPGSEIDATVQRYRKSLAGPQDVLQAADQDGQWLYRTLIAPAKASLKQNAKVYVIPDSSLNNLNFETLLVPGPTLSQAKLAGPKPSEAKLHYWIEDATVANASSLRILGAAGTAKPNRGRSLLLIGNSVAPSDKYPELAKAAAQMEDVARHFPAAEEKILTRQDATPPAYLASTPERFSYIHFVAHGTASRLSPLDSAIVLSKATAEDNSFKLYASDVVSYHKQHPLRAELVTISACYSAGERSYSGEGLVGLSWAFLHAGAHNVIAALWDASDDSTELLMNKFYEELDKGASPDAALHAAKLFLLHNSGFHNPFDWAPFQLYARLG